MTYGIEAVSRMGQVASDIETVIYAWTLMTNHALCGSPHKAWFGMNTHA
jgi:hypothetical protein